MSRLRPSRRTLLRSGLLLGLGGVRQWFSPGLEKYANKIRPVTGVSPLSLDLADGQPGPVTEWGDHLTGDEYPGR